MTIIVATREFIAADSRLSLSENGLRATQQRQVQHAEYWRMPPVSYAMAFCDVFLMTLVVRSADSSTTLMGVAIAMGTGSSIGSMLGTWLHARKHEHSARS